MDNHTQLWGYKDAKAFLNAYVPPDVVAKVNDAVLASCDAADGVKDGLIQNPAKCSFDPQSLVPATLTQAQADSFKSFLRATPRRARPRDLSRLVRQRSCRGRRTGRRFCRVGGAFGAAVRTQNAAEPWGANPPVLWAAAEGFTKYIDLRDPAFDFNHGWPEMDGQVGEDALKQFDERLGVGDVDQPERLADFFAKGKKLILYHGYDRHGDLALPHRLVLRGPGQGNGRLRQDPRERARLFTVPGMLHCLGGPGPNDFDTLGALEAWVEQGKAGEGLVIAAKFPDNKPGPAAHPYHAAVRLPRAGPVQGRRRRQRCGKLDLPRG